MAMASTTVINSLDLINLAKDIAQLNLGYLGISVAILGVLGGVFVYFNIKPIQDKLGKQEEVIENLKKEANDLLSQADDRTESALTEFKDQQTKTLTNTFDKQKETINLEVLNKINVAESRILEKVDLVTTDKDSKLKEILLAEMTTKVLTLEKSLTAVLDDYKKVQEEKISSLDKKVNSSVKEIERDILELKAYKYDMEGKMGGIIFTIEAVEKCVKEEPYLLKYKLDDLKEKIGKYNLTPELFIRLKAALNAIETKGDEHNAVIKEIKDLVTLQEKPEM